MTFATYDFETYDWVKPICFGLATEAGEDFYLNREDPVDVAVTALRMMEAASFENEIKTFWAHNGGKFDALFFVDPRVRKACADWHFSGVCSGSRVIILRCTSERTSFELKDSFAVIQSSLAKALESFDIPAKKVFTKADYDALETNPRAMLQHSDKKLEAGCLADCKSLYMLLQKASALFVDWGGQLKTTFSSSALSVVKASIDLPLPSHDGHQDLNETCANGYFGGRVEVFKHKPNAALREYDVTSSYPYSMGLPLPWELIGRNEKPTLHSGESLGMVLASVEVPDQYLPPLPYRPTTGGLFFPVGKWTAWFTTVELRYAVQSCGVQARLHDAIDYTVDAPFAPFIAKVFALKAKSTGATREFCKLVMNGCYGKFAQRPELETLKVFGSKADAWKWAQENARKQPTAINTGSTAWSVKHKRWPKQTHYALASTITAYSRILLHQRLLEANHSPGGHRIAYCDTDSIHTDSIALEHQRNNDLGGLALKHENYTAQFYAPKLYKLTPANGDTIYASKGFPVSADTFERIVKGELVGRPKGRMQLFKTMLRQDAEVRHLNESETEKAWNGRSSKRKLLKDSPEGDTTPWTVDELQHGAHLEQRSPLAVSETDATRAKRRSRKTTG